MGCQTGTQGDQVSVARWQKRARTLLRGLPEGWQHSACGLQDTLGGLRLVRDGEGWVIAQVQPGGAWVPICKALTNGEALRYISVIQAGGR